MSSQGNISLDPDRHTRAEPYYFLGLLVAALGLQGRQLWQVVRATRPPTAAGKGEVFVFQKYAGCYGTRCFLIRTGHRTITRHSWLDPGSR